MPGQHSVKFALDKLHFHAIRDKIVPWEAMPLFPHAQSQIELADRRKVDPFLALFPVAGNNARRQERYR